MTTLNPIYPFTAFGFDDDHCEMIADALHAHFMRLLVRAGQRAAEQAPMAAERLAERALTATSLHRAVVGKQTVVMTPATVAHMSDALDLAAEAAEANESTLRANMLRAIKLEIVSGAPQG